MLVEFFTQQIGGEPISGRQVDRCEVRAAGPREQIGPVGVLTRSDPPQLVLGGGDAALAVRAQTN